MKLSVIIANRNDDVMLSVTLKSVLEDLRDASFDYEVVIADNSSEEIYKSLPSFFPKNDHVRILRQDFPCLFTARELAARESFGEYILCIDSHMLVGKNLCSRLVEFADSFKGPLGFAHAPLQWLHQSKTTHDRDMNHSELGSWRKAFDHEAKISWKGIPWLCSREWFLTTLGAYGALSEHRLSWGGGDMHIGIKPWLLGYENWAVPCAPAVHIGPFPSKGLGYRYRLYSDSGGSVFCLGFLVSSYVLGGEKMMLRNKEAIQNRFGRFINVEDYWQNAILIGKREKEWLDERKVTTFDELLENPPWEIIETYEYEPQVLAPKVEKSIPKPEKVVSFRAGH